MLGWCLGVVGVSLNDFTLMTPKEAEAVCRAYRDADEQREHEAWERSRIVAYSSVSPYFGKNKQMSPHNFLPFPWDREAGKRPKSEEGNRKSIEMLAALAGNAKTNGNPKRSNAPSAK